jgi:hypothetical protein
LLEWCSTVAFSTLLLFGECNETERRDVFADTKIGNGDMLTLDKKALLESRFKHREQSTIDAPKVVR